MNNRDLLDILGEIDEELIEDAAPVASAERVDRPKKFNFGWIQPLSIAASFVIVLGGIIAAKPLLDLINSPDIDEPDPLESQGEAPIEGNPPSGEPGDEDFNEGNGEGNWQEPDYFLGSGTITDEYFSVYDISYLNCSSERVGEKLSVISVEFYNELDGENYIVQAEVNSVTGIDGEWCLCIRYINDGEDNYVNSLLDFENYKFITVKSYSFESFADVRQTFWGGMITSLGDYGYYYKDTDEAYCKCFRFTNEVDRLLTQHISELNGEFVGAENGLTLESIAGSCGESASFICSGFMEDITAATIHVYDNGYLYFAPIGGHIFYIGEEAARELIDIIIKNGEPQGYVWNEYEGKWYPIVNNSITQFNTFKKTLENNGLLGYLRLNENVKYWETYIGVAPSSFTLTTDMLYGISDVLYSADGSAVSGKNINTLSGESVSLTHKDNYGTTIEITVYDNGYVRIGTAYYDVGRDVAAKIISIVKTEGTPPYNYEWDEENEEWHTICFEDEYMENPAGTLKEAIEQRDLYGKLNFLTNRITYRNMNERPHPDYFSITNNQLLELYNLIYSLEGSIVENPEEISYNKGALALDRLGENGIRERCMWIYGGGYINFGNFVYDVGDEATERIFNLIVRNGQSSDGSVWNETLGKWEKNGSDDKNEPDVGGGSDVYEDDDIPDNNAGSSVGSDVNIDVVPTRRFYSIVLHENDRHIDRVLDSLRVDQAAFMEEIMKDYKAEYSGVAGASFETAKLVSDEILKIPFIIPKDTVEVSAITMYYYHEYDSFSVYYTIGNLRYSFEYELLPGSFNYFGILTRKGEASFNGVSFDVYGNDTYRVGNILCPGQDDRYIKIAITSDTEINGMPALDMFEIIYLEPSSYEDIAALYEEEPVYDESEETETMVFEG